MKRLNNFWVGVIIGIILPLIFGYLFIDSTYHGELTTKELIQMMTGSSMIIKFLFIAILPNMFAVFLLNNFEFWRACRGIFLSIGLYMALAVPFLS